MRNIKIAICSIVRDCNNNLKRNIPVIEKLRSHLKSSIVIVFENDSIDGTKDIFIEWNKKSSNVYIESRDLNYALVRAGRGILDTRISDELL